ncbi:unnamed protein product [Linum tenue]|uniref:DYW domain-containing protein n=1 Tax=Linum tenue TaxID=586396 RepID=A0AAV0IFZ9_9ROSI|nr:unnamed protein product [Linum tenue]
MSRLTTRAWLISIRTLTTTCIPPSTTLPQELSNLRVRVRVIATRSDVRELVSRFCDISPPPPISYSEHIYTALFQACAGHGCLQEGRYLHRHMVSSHLDYRPDVFLSNHLLNMYAKCGDLENAGKLFDEMPQRNTVSWTTLISGYAQRGRGEECFSLFSDMMAAADCRPNEFAFSSVLACCEDAHGGKQIHSLALKLALDFSAYVGNALITMYSKVADCGEAWRVFERMGFRNRVSWNSMIAGFHGRKLWGKAVALFNEMHRDGVGFDRAALLSVIGSLSDCNVDSGISHCNQVHCLGIKTGIVSEIEVATSLLKAYSSLGGDPSECFRLFTEMDGRRDIISWTSIITAFAEDKPEEAFFLFRQLHRDEAFSPDWFTFSSILKACAGLVTDNYASSIHSLVIRTGFDSDTVLANSLIHAYARCGVIASSKQVFDEMKYCRDVVSWNSMLKAYALHGGGQEAFDLFSEMDVPPDSATFVSLLSACSHVGMVEKGTQIFNSMSEIHGVSPQLDHYACMVDILGRAGRLSEATELITSIPMEPDSVIWSSLLGSCRKHNNTELAKLAADRLTKLDPENSLGYVQMSNIFSLDGSYKEAGLIRKEMKGSRVLKEPGLSWMEIGNQVHEFASGGRRHPDREAIYGKLNSLVAELRAKGYVADTSLSFHDIEEEHKEQQLYYHSEKLALAFALVKGEENSCAGSRKSGVIRIMKNIRICVDCHSFMKLASGVLEREIVVRDSNRFHHFRDGECSCSDYW